MIGDRQFLSRVIMFGDGRNGSWTQIHEILHPDESTTGIVQTIRCDGVDQMPTQTFEIGDKSFSGFDGALAAYDAGARSPEGYEGSLCARLDAEGSA